MNNFQNWMADVSETIYGVPADSEAGDALVFVLQGGVLILNEQITGYTKGEAFPPDRIRNRTLRHFGSRIAELEAAGYTVVREAID